jgi:esterase/lipase superfamily enzyme/outer membrane protein OmpA-like peptidoglycan-associated protein
MLVSGCAATIHGTVQLVDSRQQPIPNESPKGAVVNMINTSVAVEQASSSATVDEKGEFESPKDSIKPGLYKVEASRIGYETQTETVEIGSFFSKKIQFKLPKIQEAKRKSIKGSASDEDKIINPGEVNIEPPAATPAPPPAPVAARPEAVVLRADALFATSSATLDAVSRTHLYGFAQEARDVALEHVLVIGHADSREKLSDLGALALSARRAEAVKDYLVGLGIPRNNVFTAGKGRGQPLASNKTAGGRAVNRRVEIEAAGTRSRNTSATKPSTPPKGHVPVLFATNRSKTGNNDPRDYFSSEESEVDSDSRLTLGRVIVRVPTNRQKGELKEPGFFRVTLEKISSTPLASFVGIAPVNAVNPDTDFSFASPIEELTGQAFADTLKTSLKASKTKSALVYVHGFANGFKDAAFRTAQFSYDLADEHYDVVPVLFSWPSDPAGVNYVGAGDRTWSAGKQLAAFLDKLVATTGPGVIHIIAHSKGAQVLGIALDTMKTTNLLALDKEGRFVPKFNQLILAAPDIRASDFAALVLPAIASRHSVTNYVASNDAALRASKKVNAGARAGDSGSASIFVGGVETIDVTAVNYRPGGHSSFADSPRVISDIRLQLGGSKPESRHLQRIQRKDSGYWILKE